MMAAPWNPDRWTQTGVTEAGDAVYERNVSGAKPAAKKSAAKKPAAKKKA